MVGLMKKSKTPKAKTQKTTTQTGPKKSKKSKTGSMPKSTPSKSEKSSSPKKRNLKKLILYGIPILLILALVAALIVVLLLGKFGGVEVCKTKECIMLADHLNNWKDDSIDPCQDFFKYSCGKYYEHNVAEDQMTKKTMILSGLIKEFLKKNESSSSKTENAMKHLFEKCEEFKDPAKKVRVLNIFIEQLRPEANRLGWPMMDPNWNDNRFDLTSLLKNIATVRPDQRFVINYGIFNIAIPAARKVFITSIESPHTTYFEEVQKMLNIIFPPSNKPNPLNITYEAECIVWFGKALERIDKGVTPSTMQDVDKNYEVVKSAFPDVDFDSLISDLLSKQVRSWNKVKNNIYGFKDIIKKAPEINALIRDNKRIAANYLIYQYVYHSIVLLGALEKLECHALVVHFLPFPSLRVFVRNHFDKEAIQDVDKLVETIRSSFIEMLEKSEWLHEKTRSGAIRKAKAMEKTISYPAELEKPGALDKHFNIELKHYDSFYYTMKKIDRATMNLLLDYVSSDFSMGPHFSLTSNAMYTPFGNSINVFAPLMDDPLFHTSFPNYAKIAGIGFIIGHEIGHGFDVGGIKHDENGNLRQWVDVADGPEYKKKAECLINQYDNYDDPSFGRKNWCAPRSSLPLAKQLDSKHATNSFRVNGLFANEKAFAEVFNCPVGSPMNPVKKCTMF